MTTPRSCTCCPARCWTPSGRPGKPGGSHPTRRMEPMSSPPSTAQSWGEFRTVLLHGSAHSPWKSQILVGFASITPCLKKHLSVCDIPEAQFEIVFKFLYNVHSTDIKRGSKHVGCFFLWSIALGSSRNKFPFTPEQNFLM